MSLLGSLLATIDVVGLYSHIPHAEGFEALGKFFDERKEIDVPTSELVDMVRIFLDNNYFEFDDKIYHQKLGTAMGTKFAPDYANIFMHSLTGNSLILLLKNHSFGGDF